MTAGRREWWRSWPRLEPEGWHFRVPRELGFPCSNRLRRHWRYSVRSRRTLEAEARTGTPEALSSWLGRRERGA